MGRADYLRLGDHNAQCFRCGMKRKAGDLRKQWQGFWVCPEHWEPRQPQDFAKGIPDIQTVPWSQPVNWNYVGPPICTVAGSSAIPGFMTPGCSIPGNTTTSMFP